MTSPAVDFCYVPGGPVAEVAALAALGERLGFRCLWIPDQGFFRDPFLLAAAAAAATSTIGIGIGITMPVTRHPVQIARAAATLDEMSGGRLRLGLGSGNMEHVVRPLGMPADDPAGRVRAAAEQIAALLRGESVRYAPEPLAAVRLDIDPARVPPLYVGGRGPRMLETAGAVADGVLLESLFHGSGLEHALERVRHGRATRADPPAMDVVAWQVVVVTDRPEREIEAYRPWIARILRGGPVSALLRIGVAEETVHAVRAAGDEAAALAAVTDDAVRCLVMLDDPAGIAERFGALARRGCTAVCVLSTTGFAETAENLTRIGTTVLPALAGPTPGGA
ncbi:LLM class flavin-dependent oxidoreductase [Pseudonocardia sp.]|uniref:LLM class flavin-dependent oxidoreductase n=1 Tax=Pseudonocardia sp. TaxID=60912 RepID=UPI003D1495B2